jgi:large subunit ribosomal protein L6e
MTDNKKNTAAQKKKVTTHKPKLAHKLARYVRSNPVHLSSGVAQPSITHLRLGGAPRATLSNKANTWYPADDVKDPFKRKRLAPRAQTKSQTFVPGKVLILLAGKFRGKRVVFLKTLASGLLLVTGPHKINGVPLRRVNPAYVIATSTVVPLDGVNVANVDDAYFRREVPKGKVAE